jgi:peptide/nickel transport system substrate-binding protein
MRLDLAWRRAIAGMSFASVGTVAVSACAGDAARGGTVVISAAGDADSFFPPTLTAELGRQVADLVFEKLAVIPGSLSTMGDAGWTPQLAEHWEWTPDSMSVTFHLNPRARWHDSIPVTAADVRFAFSIYTDSMVGSTDGADMRAVVDSLTVRDSLTCTAWFRRRSPERFFTLVYTLVPLPEHLLKGLQHDSLGTSSFASHPVGNGPFRLTRWDRTQRIEVTAVDGFYRGRANPDRVIWALASTPQAVAQRVFNGEADFTARLTPVEVADLPKHPDLTTARLANTANGYLVFNMHNGADAGPHPLFADRELRRALTMALDRQALVRNFFDSLGQVALGPFVRMQWSADSTLRQIAFDRANAARILDSLGWRPGKDSMRARAGKPLAFTLLTPKSAARQRFAVAMQEQWRQVGAQVEIEIVDFPIFNVRSAGHQFETAFNLVGSSPSPNLRQAWSTAAITMASGVNYGRYSNPAVDAAIDSAVAATSLSSARAHYRGAYQTLLDDAPAIWLFEPVVVAGVNRRLTIGSMRPDAWWVSIPGWRVAAGSALKADTATRKP